MNTFTREELRADILEIVTEVVTEIVNESNKKVIRMLSEDILAVSNRVDRLERRMNKGFSALRQELRDHAKNPKAHTHQVA